MYKKPSIDLGLELLANARQELRRQGDPLAVEPMTCRQIAIFVTEVTGVPVTPQTIRNGSNRAIAKLRTHAPRFREEAPY